MTDRELLYVKTVMDEHSLNKASQKLFISQPALSQAIQRIEMTIGTSLFYRTPTGLIPTEAGKKYYRMAEEILRSYRCFIQELTTPPRDEGAFLFATTTSLAASILYSLYPSFLNSHPDIRATIHEGPHYQMLDTLRQGYVNMVILYSDADSRLSEFQYHLLAKDSVIVVANPEMLSFRSARRESGYQYPVIDPQELSDHPYIKNSSINPTAEFIDSHLAQNGLDLDGHIYLQIGRTCTVVQLAAATVGFGFSPSLQISSQVPEHCKFMLPHGFFPSYNLYALLPAGNTLNAPERIFIDYVRESLKTSVLFE